MKTGKQRALNVLMNVLLIIYAIFALFPLLWMLLISFKSDTEVFTTTFIFHPTLANYQQVLLRSDYARYIRDSLIVSGGAVLVSIIVGVYNGEDTISPGKKIWLSRFFPINSHRKFWLFFLFS